MQASQTKQAQDRHRASKEAIVQDGHVDELLVNASNLHVRNKT